MKIFTINLQVFICIYIYILLKDLKPMWKYSKPRLHVCIIMKTAAYEFQCYY